MEVEEDDRMMSVNMTDDQEEMVIGTGYGPQAEQELVTKMQGNIAESIEGSEGLPAGTKSDGQGSTSVTAFHQQEAFTISGEEGDKGESLGLNSTMDKKKNLNKMDKTSKLDTDKEKQPPNPAVAMAEAEGQKETRGKGRQESAQGTAQEQKPTSMPADTQKNHALGGKGISNNSNATQVANLTYKVKWMTFKGKDVGIITQNDNGPCPLLAIMNVLLLRGSLKLPLDTSSITSDILLTYLGDYVFKRAPRDLSSDVMLNYHQNLSDALTMINKLQTGIDVNVRFTGVCDFEYTSESIIFDLLNIRLYHGWLPDPQEVEVTEAIRPFSYNQVVERIILSHENPSSLVEPKVLQSGVPWHIIAEEFLVKTSHQLTYFGLIELNSAIAEEEICVFFRNNHFSTLLKHQDELFLLVTDQGFLDERRVCWETLSNVEGDGHFVDSGFHTFVMREPSPRYKAIPLGGGASAGASADEQIENDYLVALSLQQEQVEVNGMDQAGGGGGGHPMTGVGWSDHELAMQLQEAESFEAQHMQRQHQPGTSRGSERARATRDASKGSEQEEGEKTTKRDDRYLTLSSVCTIL